MHANETKMNQNYNTTSKNLNNKNSLPSLQYPLSMLQEPQRHPQINNMATQLL